MALTSVGRIGAEVATEDVARQLRGQKHNVAGTLFAASLLACLVVAMVALLTVLIDLFRRAQPVLGHRLGDFLTSGTDSSNALAAGVWQGIKGTLIMSVIVAMVAFPLGIACAVYLEEYAPKSRFARFARINVRNLAGVPSIVYGILGLALFVKYLRPVTSGSTVFAGGLTLAVLVLPIVVITASEALRAVPGYIREGAFGIGATRWEVVRHHVLPAAGPGILTGTVLALARAAGEAAPLLLVGAATGLLITGDKSIVRAAHRRFHGHAGRDLFLRSPDRQRLWRGHSCGVRGAHRAGALGERVRHLVTESLRAEVVNVETTDTPDTPVIPEAPVTSSPEPGLVQSIEVTAPRPDAATPERDIVFAARDLAVYYGSFRAVRHVDCDVRRGEITAFIGPSGCGKSTVLRCFNRMNDLIESARVEGMLTYHGVDLYGRDVDPVEVRRRVGMVFQKPNPFPKTIYDNIAFGPRIAGVKKKAELDDIVERSLKGAALWDEVRDRLRSSAMGLSGGQQQRLCIARAIAVEPDVILMDEPCSALDPIATARIEDLMGEIKQEYTIVIVTHNMQQAARVSDRTAFFTTELSAEGDRRTGLLVEFDSTNKIFSNPSDERTEMYVTGRFG